MLLHQNSALLEGPLACLMRVPRLIDFDNKRAYFRSRIRGERERYSGSLRIHVRREHVFEDSFHQLRAKYARNPINTPLPLKTVNELSDLTSQWYAPALVVSAEHQRLPISLAGLAEG